MKKYLCGSFFFLGLIQGQENLNTCIERALEKLQISEGDLANQAPFLMAYQADKSLKEIKSTLDVLREQLGIVAQASTLIVEQHKKSQVPYSTRLYNACASCVHSVRQTYPIQMLEESPELQGICGAIVFFAALNFRLLHLQQGYYAAQDQAHKQQCKKSYQALVYGIQAVVGIEKMITVRLRDACIGFWGNGQFVKKFFGSVCDWCSLRSLFYIDEKMLE